MNAKSVWFLDVDGVINAVDPDPADRDRYIRVDVSADGKTYPIHYRPAVVDFINAVHRRGAADIVWLTTWRGHADTALAPALGLDGFGWLKRSGGSSASKSPWWWKTKALTKHLRDRPDGRFVWTDDETRTRAPAAVGALRARGLVIAPDERVGLSDDHLAAIADYLA